jgi:hypothetical protein
MPLSKADRQRLFLDNLANTRIIASALAAAGVTPATLGAWLSDLSFRDRLDRAIATAGSPLPNPPTAHPPQSSRRGFLRAVADKAIFVFGAGIATGFLGNEAYTTYQARKASNQLRRVALIPVAKTKNPESALSIAPADSHPHQTLPQGSFYYETELRLANDYWKQFFGHEPSHTQLDKPEVGKSDSILVLGSPVSNSLARDALGDLRADEPSFVRKSIDGGLQLEVHWAFHLPKQAAEMQRQELEGAWKFGDQCICSADGQKPLSAVYGSSRSKKLITTDYLLVSVLPRSSRNAGRLLIAGGLHRPGTRALSLLMDGSSDDEIEKLSKSPGVDLEGYYQALFEVGVEDGAPVATRLIAAKAVGSRRV